MKDYLKPEIELAVIQFQEIIVTSNQSIEDYDKTICDDWIGGKI